MTTLKWMIPLFAFFMLILTGWIQHVRGEEPITPWIYFTSERTGNQELFRMHPDGTVQQQLTFLDGKNEYSILGTHWIFFRGNLDGKKTIYRMRPDGSRQEPILQDYRWLVTLSPDEQWIYFMAERDGARGLYRVHIDGTQQTRLTPLENEVWFQGFDANNEWLYFTLKEDKDKNNWALYRMHLDGSEQHKLVDLAGYNEFHGFSPDNQWLYFAGGSNHGTFYRLRLADLTQEQLTPDGVYDGILNARFPISADGKWFYVSSTQHNGVFNIYRMQLDGSRRERLTQFSETTWVDRFSPNGEWLYLYKDVDNIAQIFGMQSDGTTIINLTESTSSDTYLRTFSPDGEWIYYEVDQDIYRMRLDGTHRRNLTNNRGKTWICDFSSDGKWLYFTVDSASFIKIYRMHLDGTNVEQLTPNFNGNEYWGGLGTPVDLVWHAMELKIITLVVLGMFLLGYGLYSHFSTRFAISH